MKYNCSKIHLFCNLKKRHGVKMNPVTSIIGDITGSKNVDLSLDNKSSF